jgi:glycolate oxidase
MKVFQLYVRGDDAWVEDIIDRAMTAGYDAFAFTVDVAIYSRRERDITQARRDAVIRRRHGPAPSGRC